MPNQSVFQISAEVQAAIAANRPVVALESTVIAHGLPRPQNLETALRLEQLVRDCGALPATIAILKGRPHIGLNAEQLQHIAQSTAVRKVSRRDMPIAMARAWDGATTVATTVWIAARVGITVFATGGIGGVHRGELPDISADLPELARTSSIVVCSGAKIILDLPATREWLETNGVTVIGFGSDEFPAFYSRSSGLPVDVRADNAEEVVAISRARRDLDLPGALLVTVPIPTEAEIPSGPLEALVERALAEAADRHIHGRELTPFLLSRMSEYSDGQTLRANIALLENNARVASQIAKAQVARKPSIGFVH
jgi:pseudouridine-5'-phosphate glycosidase